MRTGKSRGGVRRRVSSRRRPRCAKHSLDACRGVGAGAPAGAADRQRAAGVGGGARATAGASVRFQSNPQIDAAVGNRKGPDTRFTDFELGLGQSFEPGARRSARSPAPTPPSPRLLRIPRRSHERCSGWRRPRTYRAVHANERIKLLSATHDLASAVYAAADRRYKAGDIAVLDVNIARASLARVRASARARKPPSRSRSESCGSSLGLERHRCRGSLSRPGEPT